MTRIILRVIVSGWKMKIHYVPFCITTAADANRSRNKLNLSKHQYVKNTFKKNKKLNCRQWITQTLHKEDILIDQHFFLTITLLQDPIERLHSRDQQLWNLIRKESVYIKQELLFPLFPLPISPPLPCRPSPSPSPRNGLRHQHGRRFIVVGHQYGCRDVMWKNLIS